jgi:hydroxymethylbilane synthase
MTQPIRIGTRGSRLALWQANHVAELLRPLVAPRSVELVEIRTTGDLVRDASLAQIGGQGVFTKEIQQAVLDGRVDVAVHSLKDLPTQPVAGITLAAVPERGADSDVLISRGRQRFDDLPQGARLATGSSRRRAQILFRRPDLAVEDLRGNVETRLRKLEELNFDAIVLAQAGLERLGLQSRITERLDSWMLPAVGQGAIGVEVRANDAAMLETLRQLNHIPSWQAVIAERAFLRGLGGGCLMPIAARGVVKGESLSLIGAVFHPQGERRVQGEITGPTVQAETLGEELARRLLGEGARELLGSLRLPGDGRR